MRERVLAYLSRAAAWFSQGINAVLLGGHHDQTVSARCYVNRYERPWAYLRVGIDWFAFKVFKQQEHCKKSHEADVQWAQEVLRG